MENILEQLAVCVERGKVNNKSSFPPELKGQDGADELTKKALESNIAPDVILNKALIIGMKRIGDKFEAGKAFIPDMLIAAKAMKAAMEHLRPFFESGEVKQKGTFVIGTVSGDLHDIGKNIVRMVLTGNGWKVIDLGVDVPAEKFVDAVVANQGCMVGLSALLTTTMVHMKDINAAIKEKYPNTKVFVGGAPLSHSFNDEIGADGYFPDPNKLVKYLDTII